MSKEYFLQEPQFLCLYSYSKIISFTRSSVLSQHSKAEGFPSTVTGKYYRKRCCNGKAPNQNTGEKKKEQGLLLILVSANSFRGERHSRQEWRQLRQEMPQLRQGLGEKKKKSSPVKCNFIANFTFCIFSQGFKKKFILKLRNRSFFLSRIQTATYRNIHSGIVKSSSRVHSI